MRHEACDICSGSGPLIALRETYQTASVQEVCRDCEAILNERLPKMQELATAATRSWMRRLIDNLVAAHKQHP